MHCFHDKVGVFEKNSDYLSILAINFAYQTSIPILSIHFDILNPNQAVFFGQSKNRGGAESAPYGT